MNRFFSQIGHICRMIKIEHSIFALPWAYSGSFLAADGLPPISNLVYLTIAMVGVRSFAMTFNRLADLRIDALNERTKNRPIITGAISVKAAWIFCLVMALIFIIACAFLNDICLILSVPALIFVAVYSILKHYTPICHFWLGATSGLASLAGWLAVQPHFLGIPPIMLAFAATFWVGAFDIYYAFQDMEFDLDYGLHSIPADYGEKGAMALAGFAHILTIIFMFLTGLCANLGWPWYAFCVGIGILLIWEHRLVNPKDLRNINMPFFTLNGIISPLVLIGIILGIYF